MSQFAWASSLINYCVDPVFITYSIGIFREGTALYFYYLLIKMFSSLQMFINRKIELAEN